MTVGARLTVTFLGCLCAAAQDASIQGTVVNTVTHQPMPGVRVNLTLLVRGSMPELAYGAVSGETGRFSVAAMRPGTYVLRPESPGFVFVRGEEPDAPPTVFLDLKPGQRLDNLQLHLAPAAVLTGRAVDENGEPLKDVRGDAEHYM